MGVPGYRISEMVKNGGKVIDAFGFVNVVSPAGIPMRGIVGIAPDPLMFVAINCENVQKSKSFYEQLGFVGQNDMVIGYFSQFDTSHVRQILQNWFRT